MDELKLKVDEFIEKHNKLEEKIDRIIAKFYVLDSKFNIKAETTYLEDINTDINCNCEIYSPFIVNGPCRFCYSVNSQ
jgi:hypothetical protein